MPNPKYVCVQIPKLVDGKCSAECPLLGDSKSWGPTVKYCREHWHVFPKDWNDLLDAPVPQPGSSCPRAKDPTPQEMIAIPRELFELAEKMYESRKIALSYGGPYQEPREVKEFYVAFYDHFSALPFSSLAVVDAEAYGEFTEWKQNQSKEK